MPINKTSAAFLSFNSALIRIVLPYLITLPTTMERWTIHLYSNILAVFVCLCLCVWVDRDGDGGVGGLGGGEVTDKK